jgi:hypothetical protein
LHKFFDIGRCFDLRQILRCFELVDELGAGLFVSKIKESLID